MSRCRACNVIMTEKEDTRKYASNPTVYVELCNHCFKDVADEIPVIEGKGSDGEEQSEETQ